MSEARLRIEGMTCKMCPATIEKALGSLEGVQRAVVVLDAKTAEVEYDPAKVTVEDMIKAVEGAGKYQASPM